MSMVPTGPESDESKVQDLYRELLGAWNHRDAAGMARLVEEQGVVVGFDGSQMEGPAEVHTTLEQIFRDHPTGTYIGKIRGTRVLSSDVAMLRAVAGMVPAAQSDLNPQLHAVQSMVAVRKPGGWRIALYQNTPAAFHGRPDLMEELTRELREELAGQSSPR